jgi:hypothetical protein
MTQENSRPGGYIDHAVPPEDIFPELPKHRGRRTLRLLLLVGELLLVWVGVPGSIISPSVASECEGGLEVGGRTYPLGDLLSTT